MNSWSKLGVALCVIWSIQGCDQELTVVSPGLSDSPSESSEEDVAEPGGTTTDTPTTPSVVVVGADPAEDTRIEETGDTPQQEAVAEDDGGETEEEETEEEEEEESQNPVTLQLATGYMGANGTFTETGNTLYTCAQHSESNQQFLVQVGATLEGGEGLDPDFIQFKFTSDTSEWVGTEGNSVFQSFEACDGAQQSCDEVVIGEGTSGYPDAGAGHMGIQNVMCRYWEGPGYTIQIFVQALDLLGGTPDPEVIGEATVTIECEPVSCCPPVEYMETLGNHTTEPWDCDE